MDSTPLGHAVKRYIRQGFARMHMPGHKGRPVPGMPRALAAALPYDITEVAGTDSLYHAHGPILESERLTAQLYGAKGAAFSTGGATLCIQAMLALACRPGGRILMSRNIHRSAINACALLDLTPVWIYPRADAGRGFLGRYSAADVRAALEREPDVQAVYITSPDYFGVMSDLTGISCACARLGVPLLVDNAHGAHLAALPAPWDSMHPIACGASLCADSLHKTLPAMTGAAVLLCGADRFLPNLKRAMSMFGSTSPSYPVLLSCEQATAYATGRGRAEMARACQRLRRIGTLARKRGFLLPKGVCDPMRLALYFGHLGLPAARFGAYLRAQGIEPEYISRDCCVLMASGHTTLEEFARLYRAIDRFRPPRKAQPGVLPADRLALPRCEAGMRVRAAAFAEQEEVSVIKAVGRIAGAEQSPCPPGIPLMMSGERISPAAMRLLLRCGVRTVRVVRESEGV